MSLSLKVGTNKETQKPIYDWQEGDKETGAVCDWYSLYHSRQKISGLLSIQEMYSHGPHPCKYYVCSVPPPQYASINGKNVLSLQSETVTSLSEIIKEFCV